MQRTSLTALAAVLIASGSVFASAFAQQAPPSSQPGAAPAPPPADHRKLAERMIYPASRETRGQAPGSFVLRTGRDASPLGQMPGGMWWKSQETITKLNLTPDQQKRIDDTFRQNRLQLIDLKASLEKEQINLEPILNAPALDSNKAMAEISKIADMRAELEKSHARMLLGIRGILTTEQWTKLQGDYRERSMHVFGPAGFTMPAIDIPAMDVQGFKTKGVHVPAMTIPQVNVDLSGLDLPTLDDLDIEVF